MRSQTLMPAVLFACMATAAAAQPDYEAEGGASWYGEPFHGRKTASGERFDMHGVTAAHRTLPLGSIIEVTNLDNARTIQVRVNDRGPYKGSRIIDVSREAADQLGFRQQGLARVRVKYVGRTQPSGLRPMMLAESAVMIAPPADPATGPADASAAAAAMIATALEPAAATAVAPGPVYAVQAGAFSKRANAERVAAALADAGPVEIRLLELRGASLHRVLVGAYVDKAAAEAAVAGVEAAGFGEAQVVKAF